MHFMTTNRLTGRVSRLGRRWPTVQDGPAPRGLGRSARFQERISNSNDFQFPNGFWNLVGLWEFAQGDLWGIFMRGYFLNSSRILKDFRKIQYAIP
jgi:hypothetical protein